MQALPEFGYLRLNQIVGHSKTVPPAPPIIPISKSTLWRLVREERFPAPCKLSPGVTVWRVEEIRAYIENNGQGRV